MGTEYIAVACTILFTIATSTLLGGYMYKLFSGQRTWLDPIFMPIEKLVLRLIGADPNDQQDWKRYAFSLLISNVFMWLATWTIVTLQQYLPLNPDGIGDQEPTLAFNTISSFVTNTNLQHYSGETGLSYLSQMFVITFLQFVTAATGVAAAVAIIRGLAGNRLQQLGNFYVDLTRATVRLFLPLALLVSVLMIWQGTPQTFEPAATAMTVEGAEQKIARGVTAGVVSIKQLGTNGGGYFGPNSTHPYENPTPLSNFIETWSITIIPMSMVVMLGYFTGRKKLAVVIFATMLAIYLPMVVFGVAMEAGGNPAIAAHGRRSVDRVDGGQGSPLWRWPLRPVGGDDDGHVERVGQRHARLVDATGRPDATGRHVAQQHLRRRRRGLHQHADLRHRRRLRCGHDDRPHAGIPRQKGRGQGSEAGEHGAAVASARDPDPDGDRLLSVGDHARSRNGAGVAEEPGSAWLLRDALRVHLVRGQQRLGVRRPGRQHAVLEHRLRPGDAAVAIHPDHRAAGAGRVTRREARGSGDCRIAPC